MKISCVLRVAFIALSCFPSLAANRSAVKADEPDKIAGGANEAETPQSESDQAEAIVEKGRGELQKAQSAEDPAEKAEHRKKSREFFEEARRRFQAAHDGFKDAYEKFDKFIPKEDAARYEARERAYVLYIRAQLNLALTTYSVAQSWEPGTAEKKALLAQAAKAFDLIHARYRQQIAGLYARMYQGKCFEEQNDLVKALGIYNELLGHGGDKPSAALKRLQDNARLYRLVCLNREERKDHAVVIQEAEAWLAENEETAATRVGLGVQWELARAREQVALKDETGVPERRRLLIQALATAQAIERVPGEYKAQATRMIERLRGELGD